MTNHRAGDVPGGMFFWSFNSSVAQISASSLVEKFLDIFTMGKRKGKGNLKNVSLSSSFCQAMSFANLPSSVAGW